MGRGAYDSPYALSRTKSKPDVIMCGKNLPPREREDPFILFGPESGWSVPAGSFILPDDHTPGDAYVLAKGPNVPANCYVPLGSGSWETQLFAGTYDPEVEKKKLKAVLDAEKAKVDEKAKLIEEARKAGLLPVVKTTRKKASTKKPRQPRKRSTIETNGPATPPLPAVDFMDEDVIIKVEGDSERMVPLFAEHIYEAPSPMESTPKPTMASQGQLQFGYPEPDEFLAEFKQDPAVQNEADMFYPMNPLGIVTPYQLELDGGPTLQPGEAMLFSGEIVPIDQVVDYNQLYCANNTRPIRPYNSDLAGGHGIMA